MSLHLSTNTRTDKRISKEKTSEVQNSSSIAVLYLYLFVASFTVTDSKMSSALKLKKKQAVEKKLPQPHRHLSF